MGETAKTEKAPKRKWREGLKSEFKKLVWPDKKTLAKQTLVVMVLSVFLGGIIAIIDFLVQYGLDFLIR